MQLFAALDLTRLPSQVLLSPWIPAQVHAVNVFVGLESMKKTLETLLGDSATNTAGLKTLDSHCIKLENKLNIVDQRTVVNGSQVSDAVAIVNAHCNAKK